jgi:hypothetical protein
MIKYGFIRNIEKYTHKITMIIYYFIVDGFNLSISHKEEIIHVKEEKEKNG